MNEVDKLIAEWNTLSSPEEIEAFKEKVTSELKNKSEKEVAGLAVQFEKSFNKFAAETEEFIEVENLKNKLEPILPYISISQIAKDYFGKSRNWLYQKLNGNIVNGKRAQFNKSEISILKNAINDITKKMQTVSASLS